MHNLSKKIVHYSFSVNILFTCTCYGWDGELVKVPPPFFHKEKSGFHSCNIHIRVTQTTGQRTNLHPLFSIQRE